MSRSNYEYAISAVTKCKHFRSVGGRTNEEIKKAEKILDIKFSPQTTDFYQNFGYLSFDGNEVFGINPNDDSGIMEGNSVAWALNDRAEYNLPAKWLPIYNYNDGCMLYLDYDNCNDDGEPRVIEVIFDGEAYQILGTAYDDFGDFLYGLVTESLGE